MKAIMIALISLITLTLGCAGLPQESSQSPNPARIIELPEPQLRGDISLEETLFKRRSVREYSTASLSLEEVSQLLWAAQGITAGWGGRTAPSAGGTYPLEIYLVVGRVDELSPGVYKYRPDGHQLREIVSTDVQTEVAKVVLDQVWVRDGAIVIIIAAVFERTTGKYGERGRNYVYIEAGHAAQNILLQATALDLGAVPVGAFEDGKLKQITGMADDEVPLYVIPAGRKI